MKYSRKKIDFSLNYIRLIHIPKTGGISIRSSFEDVLGQDVSLKLRDDRINEINKSLFQKYHRKLKRKLSVFRQEISGRYKSDRHYCENFDDLKFVYGHSSLGNEPKQLKKEPLFICVVRDPLERLYSDYQFTKKSAAKSNRCSSDLKKEKALALDFDAYVDFFYKLGNGNFFNTQSRYLSSSSDVKDVFRIIDEKIYLAAPIKDMQQFGEMLFANLLDEAPVIGYKNQSTKSSTNISISSETMKKINTMFENDFKLYDYVDNEFQKLLNG